jgi:short-subunit dehydrogenase
MIEIDVKKCKEMQGKVIVIVGATGGIGAALTLKLRDAGAKLVLVARNQHRLDQLQSHLGEGASVLTVATDITQPDQVEAAMQKAIARFDRIDALVNAAGAGVMKQFNKLEPKDLDAMLDLNLKGSFYTTQAAANVMKEQRSGHICNVIGILGKHSMPMAAAYCASKFGAVGLSKCIAEEVRRHNIKLTLFYFGGVDTPFWDHVALKVDRSKMLRPETAADAIFYALSAEPQAVPMEINLQPDSHLFF